MKELQKRSSIVENKKLSRSYSQFEKLLEELRKKEIPEKIISSINTNIDQLNSVSGSEKEFKKQLFKTRGAIILLLEKELKIVTKNHYRNSYLAIGMAVIGVPLGVILGIFLDNMGLIGIGLPFGMVIGMLIGANMDKKAFVAGKQIDLDMNC